MTHPGPKAAQSEEWQEPDSEPTQEPGLSQPQAGGGLLANLHAELLRRRCAFADV